MAADAWTPEAVRRRMERLCEKHRGDREVLHMRLDDLLCAIARHHGYGDAVRVFRDTDKWYA